MAVEKLPSDYEENTRQKLIDAECPKFLLFIFNFAFSPMVLNLMNQLDAEFSGKRGRKAYPRVLLLIVVMYCFSENINKYTKISKECKKNKYLNIILNDRKISRNTFANFLNNSNNDIIHRVFISTLVRLNDINVFSIAKVFIDGTDILVRASRNYYIQQKDLKAMYQLHEWELLHDGSKKGIEKSLEGLDSKLEEFKDDEEIVKLIKLAKRRIKIHKHKVFAKRRRYEKEFEKRGDVKLSIVFPESVLLKTKRGIFDFAFNMQEVMTSNRIIFVGIMISHPNDQKAIPLIYRQMKKTLDIYLEMQAKYGQRDNPDKHLQAFANIILIADAGYFTVVNVYYVFKNKINALIKPSTESREDNDKLRKRSGNPTTEKKSIRKYLTRVKGGYKCENGGFYKYVGSIAIKHHKPHKDDFLPKVCKSERQIYERKKCKNCPYDSECPTTIEDRKPFVLRWMTERFHDKRRNINYKDRMPVSEGINAYSKPEGIKTFVATTPNAVDNECDLRNAIFNSIREITFLEEGY